MGATSFIAVDASKEEAPISDRSVSSNCVNTTATTVHKVVDGKDEDAADDDCPSIEHILQPHSLSESRSC